MIELRGATARNLASLDLDLQPGTWIAVTGVSGSGKSALVFDTLVREGQRRFLGALTPRARLYLGKLGRAPVQSLKGLPPTLAIGGTEVHASSRSTVGTRSGMLDLLRLWFAREAIDPHGEPLSRASFGFNGPGACEACLGLGVSDHVDPELLIADPAKSIRTGALVPTLSNGYTVYSQVTLDVMNSLCEAHGFDVDTPWCSLTPEQKAMVLYGTEVMKVPFGKHSIASRMKWKGITARPREEGYYRGLIPVITETLARSRNPNILRFVRSVPCSSCAGTRLGRSGRMAVLGSRTLPSLLAEPLSRLKASVDALPASAVAEGVRPVLRERVERAEHLQLAHLSLDRPMGTLSGGEAQRLSLATQLQGGLGGFLVALDEPTLGLHPEAVPGLGAALDALVAQGNTLIAVEHDPELVRFADAHVSLGPGAGVHGGRCVRQGPPGPHPLGKPANPRSPGAFESSIRLLGARLHNLRGDPFVIPRNRWTVVLGPSGAGKSSLVMATLLPALQGKPGACFDALQGWTAAPVHALDARPLGRTPRSTPATWSGIFDVIRKVFATTPRAKAEGWAANRFSFNTVAGRCATCEGLGVKRIGMHLLEDVEQACASCGGLRYAAETLTFRWAGLSIAEVLDLTAEEASKFFTQNQMNMGVSRKASGRVVDVLEAMCALGIGHIRLGQSSTTLSRGEAQRVKLATLLGTRTEVPGVVVMDEPDRGLHPSDVARLIAVLRGLVEHGHTVVTISHHRQLWAAADHRVGLRDGAVTAEPAIHWGAISASRAPRDPVKRDAIVLRGVHTHSLQGIDVRLPHGAFSVVVGPSGSGKSSLVSDTLAAEAWHRFAETLPFQVRRFARRMPRPQLSSAEGLGPTILLRQGRDRAGPRSTVATQTGLGPLLRLWWSRAGDGDGLSAEHFSANSALGACKSCHGMGTEQRCSPSKLLTHPDRSLLGGAMEGSRPGRFFGEVNGQYMATLQAAAPGAWDQPWCVLPAALQHAALFGTGSKVVKVRWTYSRGKRSGEHSFEGPWVGLCALVEEEARRRAKSKAALEWAAPLEAVPCPVCRGDCLQPLVARVQLAGRTLPEVLHGSVEDLVEFIDQPGGAVSQIVREEIRCRLAALVDLGLGHLALNRPSASLSDGELQRVHISHILGLDLAGLTLVLDEPGAGLDEAALQSLGDRLLELCQAGHTVVAVSHRPALIRRADHLLELGPGAGASGGRVVAAGPTSEILAGNTLTATCLRQKAPQTRTRARGAHFRFLGCRARTLKGFELTLPATGLVAFSGPSGSGKSTALHEVVEASVRAKRPVGCDDFAMPPGESRPVVTAAGFTRSQTIVEHLELLRTVQGLFQRASDLPAAAFSFRSPKGRCPSCKGRGAEVVSMDFLADVAVPCAACQGRRYRPETLAVQWEGLCVHDLMSIPAGDLALPPGNGLQTSVDALVAMGLGHLPLGRSRQTLSEGEAQRVVLTRVWLQSNAAIVLLDEPGRGLHEADLAGLTGCIEGLVACGCLVVMAAHRSTLLHAADQVVRLGPGSGPHGGHRL